MAGSKELSSFNFLGAEHQYDRKKVRRWAGVLTAGGLVMSVYVTSLAIPFLALGLGTLWVTKENGKQK